MTFEYDLMARTGIKIFTVILLALTSFKSSAQFSLTGNDPAALRWRQMETENFRLIFPKGEDSLARVYGTELEVARLRIARSSGYLIGQSYKGKMPVVLHSRYVLPNASVTWAPKGWTYSLSTTLTSRRRCHGCEIWRSMRGGTRRRCSSGRTEATRRCIGFSEKWRPELSLEYTRDRRSSKAMRWWRKRRSVGADVEDRPRFLNI